MRIQVSNKILIYFLVFLLAALSFPVIAAWIPQLQKIWILLVTLFLVVVFLSHKITCGNASSALLIYTIVVFANALMGDALISSTPIAIVEVLLLFVPAAITIMTFKSESLDIIKYTLIVSVLFFVIEAISSFIMLRTEPGLIRILYKISIDEGDRSLMYSYYKFGLFDYSMAHAMPMLIPPLLYAYKRFNPNKVIRIVLALLIALTIYLSWISDSTTALMLSVLFFIIGIVTNTSGVQNNILKLTFILLIAVPFIVSDTVQLTLLDGAESVLGSESVFAEKIDEFRYSIMNDDMTGDMQGRVDRYNKSISLFFENPLWGSNKQPGNHASLIDRLGSFGLLGFIPLILFILRTTKEISSFLTDHSRMFLFQGVLAGTIMLATKGMWVWPIFFNMFILLPFILYITDLINKENA